MLTHTPTAGQWAVKLKMSFFSPANPIVLLIRHSLA